MVKNRIIGISLFITLIFPAAGFSENLGILKGIFDPGNIEVSGRHAYIIEGATVHVFSLPDLRLVRTFGREGDGPGELKVTSWLANCLYLRPESIVVDSIDKYIIFSKEGEVLKEERRSQNYPQSIPAGEVFIVRERKEEEEKQYSSINILNPESQSSIELYKQEFSAGFHQINALPDSIHYTVYNDRIYIEESPQGFVFEVFDLEGNRLNRIDKKYTPARVNRRDREEAEERIKIDPFTNNFPGGWEAMKKQTKFLFPNRFPSIRDFVVADDKIYVQTFHRQDGLEEYVILDLEGNLIKRARLPESYKPGFTEEMMGSGIKYYSFSNDSYYYLKISEEWCELHRENLK
ncbi:hypothetical protein ACFLT9_13425 [Acidobacteriota bacterium]